MYKFLLLLSVAVAIGFQGWRTMLNNFAVDEAGINGFEIGSIQSLREVPGFLTFLVVYVLLICREHKLSVYSVTMMGIGIIMTGFMPSFWGLMLTTVIMSIGFHYYETTNQSLTLQYFTKSESPTVIGQLKSLTALSNIAVGALVWLLSKCFPYQTNYIIIGGLVIIAAIWANRMKPDQRKVAEQKRGLVFKRKYWLFYVLNLLSGARRQIFVVFAVYMLVEKYQYSLEAVTLLFVINNVIAYFTNPIAAKLINRFGEKTVLTIEYAALILIFACYAIFENFWVAGVLYILDHLFFPLSMGIKTWFHKIAEPEDIGPSIAVGFAINHIAAVFIPVLGGLLWMIEWRIPFYIGVGLAVISLFFARKITTEME